MVAFYPIDYTNNYLVISQNDMMVSINSGLEVDSADRSFRIRSDTKSTAGWEGP